MDLRSGTPLYLSPVRNDAGKVVFFFASQLDVTDRVKAQTIISKQKLLVEQEVEARTSDLEAALDAKTLLLHEVDHRVKKQPYDDRFASAFAGAEHI